jgi:poly(3-hydroxybutyrate) depolymerase
VVRVLREFVFSVGQRPMPQARRRPRAEERPVLLWAFWPSIQALWPSMFSRRTRTGARARPDSQAPRPGASANRCTDNRKSGPLPHADPDDDSYVMISRWTNCAPGAPVVLYRIQGGGHRIPGHREGWPVTNILLGKMNRDFEAAYALWNFFNDKKRVNSQAQ